MQDELAVLSSDHVHVVAAEQPRTGRKPRVVAGGVDDGPNGADDDVRLTFFRYLDEVVTVHGGAGVRCRE
jgi:hypothetical protein